MMHKGVLKISGGMIKNNLSFPDRKYPVKKILRKVFSEELFVPYKKGVTSFSNPIYADMVSVEFGNWENGNWERTHIDKAKHIGIQCHNFINSVWADRYMTQKYLVGIQRKISRRTEIMFVVYPIELFELNESDVQIFRNLFSNDEKKYNENNRFSSMHKQPYPCPC